MDFRKIGVITVLIIALVAALSLSSLAYNADPRAGDPPIMGHSSGEVEVEVNGESMSLQRAIDEKKIEGPSSDYDSSRGLRAPSYMATIGLNTDEATARAACPADWNLASYQDLVGSSHLNIVFTFDYSFIGSAHPQQSLTQNSAQVQMNTDDIKFLCWKQFDEQQHVSVMTSDDSQFSCMEGYHEFNMNIVSGADDNYMRFISNSGGFYLGGADSWSSYNSKQSTGWMRTHASKSQLKKACVKLFNSSVFPVVFRAKSASNAPQNEGFECRSNVQLSSRSAYADNTFLIMNDNSLFIGGTAGWNKNGENHIFNLLHTSSMGPSDGGVTCVKFYETKHDYGAASIRTVSGECANIYGDDYVQLGPVSNFQDIDVYNSAYFQKTPHGLFFGGLLEDARYKSGEVHTFGSYDAFAMGYSDRSKKLCYKIQGSVEEDE